MSNDETEIAPPPHLEVNILDQDGAHVLVNGFVRALGEDPHVSMAVYVNNELELRQRFFPIRVTLRQTGPSVIRLVATDAHGSTTTREIVATHIE